MFVLTELSYQRTIGCEFNDESIYVLSRELVGPTINKNQGIIGESVDLTLERRRCQDVDSNYATHYTSLDDKMAGCGR